jgi:hypothetical protein
MRDGRVPRRAGDAAAECGRHPTAPPPVRGSQSPLLDASRAAAFRPPPAAPARCALERTPCIRARARRSCATQGQTHPRPGREPGRNARSPPARPPSPPARRPRRAATREPLARSSIVWIGHVLVILDAAPSRCTTSPRHGGRRDADRGFGARNDAPFSTALTEANCRVRGKPLASMRGPAPLPSGDCDCGGHGREMRHGRSARPALPMHEPAMRGLAAADAPRPGQRGGRVCRGRSDGDGWGSQRVRRRAKGLGRSGHVRAPSQCVISNARPTSSPRPASGAGKSFSARASRFRIVLRWVNSTLAVRVVLNCSRM